MTATKLPMTPLQRIVGFEVAEETYDLLPLTAQIILDLKIEGYTEQDIATVLGCAQSTVNDLFRKARFFLANSKMRMVLETRVHYRETHSSVASNDHDDYLSSPEGYSVRIDRDDV